MLRRQLGTAAMMTVVLSVLLGLAYPLVVTGVAQAVLPYRANGSLVHRAGGAIGSALIGQSFADENGQPLRRYFQPRPSAAGASGYDTTATGGSNLGPSDATLLRAVSARVAAYRELNGMSMTEPVPVDAVTASGSGIDPDISVANALDQASRIAAARHLDPATVRRLIDAHRASRPWGFLGEDAVNVLDLNLALDRMV